MQDHNENDFYNTIQAYLLGRVKTDIGLICIVIRTRRIDGSATQLAECTSMAALVVSRRQVLHKPPTSFSWPLITGSCLVYEVQ